MHATARRQFQLEGGRNIETEPEKSRSSQSMPQCQCPKAGQHKEEGGRLGHGVGQEEIVSALSDGELPGQLLSSHS